jgi:hypothetical protein
VKKKKLQQERKYMIDVTTIGKILFDFRIEKTLPHGLLKADGSPVNERLKASSACRS